MKTKEIKRKFKNLRNISPDINSQNNIRENVFNFACQNQPVYERKVIGWNWFSYVKIGAVSFALILILFVGLNSSLFNKDNSNLELSIKNEWKLADISPYLKNIFGEKELSQQELVIEDILNGEKNLENLRNSLSALENSKVDEILDHLIF